MRDQQEGQPDDFDSGVQAGLKTAASLLERLAARVQKPDNALPSLRPPKPTSQPRPVVPNAAKQKAL
jgi:hypothetical protein